jgi:hypothetical protein
MKIRVKGEGGRRWFSAAVLLLGVLALMALPVAAQDETPVSPDTAPTAPLYPGSWNDLLNGSFEAGELAPDLWDTQSFAPGAVFEWVGGQSADGGRSVKITLRTENDARWLQSVTVKPNTDYILSGWIKTRDVAHTSQTNDAGANLSILGLWDQTPPLFGTHDWTHVSVAFNSGDNSELFIYARLGHFSGVTTGTAWFDDIRLVRVRPLYVSSSQSGTVAGIAFTPGDILIHNPLRDTWAMFFDASDVGLKGDLAAMAIQPHWQWDEDDRTIFTILMSLAGAQTVPGVGRVRPWDVIEFQATSIGDNTAGTFGMYQQGHEVGLSDTGERIDAIGPVYGPTGYAIQVSTTGSVSVPEDPFGLWDDDTILNARDEDILAFDYWDEWWFAPYFDGSVVPGLAEEDVIAADVTASFPETWFLTIRGNGRIGNRDYSQKDIFMVDVDSSTWVLDDYRLLGRYWNGPAHGFNYLIDAIDIGDE